MEQQKILILAVVAMTLMVLPFNCLATYYTVGGSSGWTLPFNYTSWASGKTFVVGDKLVFKYTVGAHNTLVVNKAAYDACTATNALATHTSGNDTISLDSTGAKYYICGIPGHCAGGMKLTVTVAAANTSKSNVTAPSPSPTPSKSNVTAPTPSPTPSKSNRTAPTPSPTASPPSPSPTATPPSSTPTPPAALSPSPSSGTPSTGTPPPGSSPTGSTTEAPPPSGSNTSAAAPSFRLDGALLLAGSLLMAMAWL